MFVFNDIITDAEDLERFYRTHCKSLEKYAYSIVKNQLLAEEAVQNSLLKIINYYDNVRDFEEDRLLKYMIRVIFHECCRLLRKKGQEQHLPLPEAEDLPAVEESEAIDHILDREAMRSAIAKLEPVYRTAIVMKYYDNASNAMIAAALDVKPDSVRMILSRARAKLKAIYSESQEERV